jgi:2-polyprenyl-6-methoxyphenol hydroxylase-like FAD-dependent oxidoreductase
MTDVLIVGAGPTGLTLACDLARRGIATRIIDRAPAFPHGSRGKGLSPRSLEVLDDLGVIDRVLAAGVTHLPHRKYRGSEVVAEVDPEAGRVPTPDTPYPTGLLLPQWRIEQILRDRLAEFGLAVESGVELRGFIAHADGVTATVSTDEIRARYLIGCDGARGTVRRTLGLPLRGSTPDVQLMAVGDVQVDGLGREAWHQWLGETGGIMLCPLPGTVSFQVQASHELDDDGAPLPPTLERFQRTFDRVAGVPGVRLHNLTWASTYRVQIRMVDQLRIGPVFLAGDAAHVHPIAGGLGMNSGIQDAYNLGWKLDLVLTGAAAPDLLDTYDAERLPVASWLLDITSQRLDAVLAAIKQTGGGVDAVASTELTQLALGYPWSRLSQGTGRDPDRRPRPGDRAPDAILPSGRLFDLFRGPHFTLLGIGTRAAAAVDTLATTNLIRSHLITSPTTYPNDTLVLVRPDGYIGLVTNATDTNAVTAYLASL